MEICKVYGVRIMPGEVACPSVIELFSPQRLAKLSRCKSPLAYRLGCAAELAVMLAAGVGTRYHYDERGKPFLPQDSRFISISHSGNMGICAIAPFPISADVECVLLRDAALSSRILSPNEQNHNIDEDYLTKKWTVKESYQKLTGEGLLARFSHLEHDGEIITDTRNGSSARVLSLRYDNMWISVSADAIFDTETHFFDLHEATDALLRS